MSALRFTFDTGAVTAAATLTFCQFLAATNQKFKVERIRVSGKSVTAADLPVMFQVLRQTTAGTASAGTMRKVNTLDTETLQTTALQTFTVEPTASDVLYAALVPPQGSYDFVFPPMRELIVPGAVRLGVRALSPSQSSIFVVTVDLEE